MKILNANPSLFNLDVPVGLLKHLDTPPPPVPSLTPSRVTSLTSAHPSSPSVKQVKPSVHSGQDPNQWLDELNEAVKAENDAARGEFMALLSLHDTLQLVLDKSSTSTPGDNSIKSNVFSDNSKDLNSVLSPTQSIT
eukprot:GHVN01094814.1.p2 GENE.GHVN01094814.1~~GHVN01094814.1.p2  ORF type:complete len:137 (-),score=24.30 GHVN01094814.1:582-992(-)